MNEPRRLDEATIFEGKLRFLIPHEWVEGDEEESGTYVYYAPNARAAWFRVSLVSAENVASPSAKLMDMFRDRSPEVDSETGNYIVRSEKDSVEDGTTILIYNWFVANSVPPSTVREAIFSYTILAAEADAPETKNEVELIDSLVRRAKFA